MQTFTLLKLQAARPLLMRTNLTIKEISERCGFENPLYFSRRFSQTYGCSPSDFREQLRSGKMVPGKNLLPVDLMTRIRW
jgi:AraC-like DNA-binding protein